MTDFVDFVIGEGMEGIIRAREAADWLEKEMPNPPTDQAQRWDLYSDADDTCIRFYDEKDSVIFALKWL
jgi:hypothetical protein